MFFFLDNDIEINIEKVTPTLTLVIQTNEKAVSRAELSRGISNWVRVHASRIFPNTSKTRRKYQITPAMSQQTRQSKRPYSIMTRVAYYTANDELAWI
jgi:hypothetical protein